jgi:hypothetical protein
LQPDLVWFPAQWPETYSYTLSACLQAGKAIVAPNLGAFAERLSERAWTWLLPLDMSPAEWVAFFTRVRNEHFITGKPPEAAPAFLLTATDLRMGNWSYGTDYLGTLNERHATVELPPSLIAAHLPGVSLANPLPPKATEAEPA